MQGLARLPKLHSLVVSGDWQFCGTIKDSVWTPSAPESITGLRSVHACNPFHLYPETTHQFIAVYGPQLTVLFRALALAKSLIDAISFSLLCDASYDSDDVIEPADAGWSCLLQAYQGLRLLNLHLFEFDEDSRFLPRLLGFLSCLEKLVINVAYDNGYLSIASLCERPSVPGHNYVQSGLAELRLHLCIFVNSCRQMPS